MNLGPPSPTVQSDHSMVKLRGNLTTAWSKCMVF